MRHFDFLDPVVEDRLFLHPPQPFSGSDDPGLVGTALGATLYCPGTRPTLAEDVERRAAHGVRSVVACLEDSVPDDVLAEAEANTVSQLRHLARRGEPAAMVFVRVRDARQAERVLAGLGDDAAAVLSGFVAPKFEAASGAEILEAVVRARARLRCPLLLMPVLESPAVAHGETRTATLVAARRVLDAHRDVVPAVRIGATDLSGTYGLRRPRELTVWDIRVVADAIAAVVDVFGGRRSPAGDATAPGDPGTGYVVTGAVWEYFSSSPERIFKPQLRESPFTEHEDRALRAELLARDLDGLIREVVLDRANGLTGKTVIHPTHVPAVHALSVVSAEEHADALDVLAGESGGVTASTYGNKMNESRPHAAWAHRTLLRAHAFGVTRPDTTFVDLLEACIQG